MSETGLDEARATVTIQDRVFQKYSIENTVYCVPVDEEERQRLYDQHSVLQDLFGGRLYFPRIPNPRKILDCGYGRGSWAAAVAEEHEECRVTGIDIYPMSVDEDPENLELTIYDLNDPLTDEYEVNSYDLIHSRFIGPGIHKNRWPSYVRDLRKLLKPGGWLQMVEYYLNIQSDNGRLTDAHALSRWYTKYAETMQRDRDPRIGRRLEQHMRNAGLKDVTVKKFDLHIGPWSRDPAAREIGRKNLDNISELLDSQAIWPLTQRGGMTEDQFSALTEQARVEAGDLSLKLYIPVYVVYGRKSTR